MTAALERAVCCVVDRARFVAMSSAPGYPPSEFVLEALRDAVRALALVDPTDPNHPAPTGKPSKGEETR